MQGYRAKKSLGQNFLTSSSMVKKIADSGELSPNDIVLEIGPGKGALTEALLETGAHVIAIEKDRELIPLLTKKFSDAIASGQLALYEEDALTFDPGSHNLSDGDYKLIANIPYYITGEIIRRYLSETIQPSQMVLLVQKEVAERIATRDGKESILSLSVKAYGVPKLALRVPRKYFSPQPKVDSAVISITDISHERIPHTLEERFFTLIKRAFSQKRKQLVGTVPPLIVKEHLLEFLNKKGLPATVRPEDLPFDVWKSLANLV